MVNSNNQLILYVMIVFFVAVGLLIPLLNAEFGGTASTHNLDVPDEAPEGITSGLSFVFSLATVVFWSFNVNIWVNLLLLEPLRILFYIMIYRVANPVS